MSAEKINIALILSAYDKASAVINSMTNKGIKAMSNLQKQSNKFANNSFNTGRDMAAAGLAMYAPVNKTINAFTELEDAQLSLKSTMMDANGRVRPIFEDINKLAIQLGNELPGNTADFYNMFDVMIRNGAQANDIINGTGRSAAYLAVQLKIPYETAAELAQRLQVSTGVANSDMMQFMDALARVRQLGPNVDEMQYAFQRSAGELKMMKIQGIQAMKELSPAFAILVKTMGSGERVGTNFAAMLSSFGDPKTMKAFNQLSSSMGLGKFQFIDKNGDFLGIENMMMQFERMRNLSTKQKQLLINQLVGSKGGDTQIMSTLINGGMPAYNQMRAQMAAQATLTEKVNSQLTSYKNKYDAVTGSIENTAAAMGQKLAPEFKHYFDVMNNKILPKVSAFIDKHPKLISWLLKAMVAFTGLALGGAYLSFIFGGIARGINVVASVGTGALRFFKALQFAAFAVRYHFVTSLIPGIKSAMVAFRAFGVALLTNPLTLYIAAAVALAAIVYLVVRNWSKITAFFGRVWEYVKKIFFNAVKFVKYLLINFTPIGLIYNHWSSISKFFSKVWDNVKIIFKAAITWLMGLGRMFWQAGANIIKSITNGIKAFVNKPVEAIKGMAKKIRNMLPFSPAKEGPLKDIHRIRLVETIAGNIKPTALIQAWHKTISSFSTSLRKPSPVPIFAGAGGQSNITFSPTIHLNGGATKADAKLLTDEMKKMFEKFMKDYMSNKQRVSFT